MSENMMKQYRCNLCGQSFLDDNLIKIRKQKHEIWHGKARVQKRNTTQGNVRWVECEEWKNNAAES